MLRLQDVWEYLLTAPYIGLLYREKLNDKLFKWMDLCYIVS